MFQSKFALAAASAVILSGCAATPWQRPADHPADPAQPAGFVQSVTALDRYREAAAQSTAPDASEAPGDKSSPKAAPPRKHDGESGQ